MVSVIDNLKIAKWQEDIRRREYARKCLAVYQNQDKAYIEELIYRHIQSPRTRELFKAYIKFSSICESVINDKSLLFKKPPKITITNAPDKINADLQELLDSVNFNSYSLMLDRYVNLLTATATVIFVDKDNDIQLDILHPDIAWIEQREDNPTKEAVTYYQKNIFENTPNRAERIDEYYYWAMDGLHEVTVNRDNGSKANDRLVTLGDDGSVVSGNPYGIIPVQWFRNYYPVGSFFREFTSKLVETNLAIDCWETVGNMLVDYNLPQLVTKGLPETQKLLLGVSSSLSLPADMGGSSADAFFLNPNMPIEMMDKKIREAEKKIAGECGLADYGVDPKDFTSGYHLLLSKLPVISENEKTWGFIERDYIALIRKLLIVANYHKGYNFPDNPDIKVELTPIDVPINPVEKTQADTADLANGRRNLVDLIMEDHPEFDTRQQAIDYLKQRDNELTVNPFAGV